MSLALASRRAALLAPWMRNELWRRARAVPSLDQRFADDRSLVDAVSGQQLITLSRVSDATVINSAGQVVTAPANTARFTHDPVTLESLGLLVEEQGTNLLLRSEEFDNPVWTMIGGGPAVTANFSVAPNGLQTADRLVFASADRGISQVHTSATVGVVYVASLYIKGVLGETIRLSPLGGIGTATNVVLTGGWQRYFISGAASGTTVGIQVNTFGGATARNIEVWGAQLEAGAFPTSYIPTVASAVTRTADIASITGAAFTGFYRQDEGTVFADVFREFAVPAGQFPAIVQSRLDNQNIISLGYLTESVPSFSVRTANILQAEIYPTGFSGVRRRRVATSYATDNFAVSVNGSIPLTDTSGSVPTGLTELVIGTALNGPIRRLTFWPQRLPNATIQALAQ